MFQIKNLIHRTAVPFDPEKNMKAAEDYLLLLLHAHVTAAAKEVLSTQLSNSESPSVADLATTIINKYLLLPEDTDSANTSEDDIGDEDEEDAEDVQQGASTDSGVKATMYAKELITLSLLWHFFHDATREGDGDRIILSWKIMLPIFKATGHRNYAKEAIILILQHMHFSDRMRHQLLWSRCINTRGRRGTNIPCDLHLEHLNRRLKTILRSMGANISPAAVVQAGKSLRTVHSICLQFEEETLPNQVSAHSGGHKAPSFEKDFETVLAVLVSEKVMESRRKKCHQSLDLRKGCFNIHKMSY